jgi:uncharacterized membrane protein
MIAGCFVLVISAIPLGLGLLVTIPMTQAAIYCAYENCKGNS